MKWSYDLKQDVTKCGVITNLIGIFSVHCILECAVLTNWPFVKFNLKYFELTTMQQHNNPADHSSPSEKNHKTLQKKTNKEME